MRKRLNLLLIVSFLITFSTVGNGQIFLGQGIMSGEISEQTAILQTRLTSSDTLIDGDLPGALGSARFEWSKDQLFEISEFSNIYQTSPEQDYIVKIKVSDLAPASRYFYRVYYGADPSSMTTSNLGTFRTLQGSDGEEEVSLVVVTGMNYHAFHHGGSGPAYPGEDKDLGYPALESIRSLNPDYFIGTGDNVYFDKPKDTIFDTDSTVIQSPAVDERGMRKRYHQQFAQSRFKSLFTEIGTYWEKDDHDYRYNDSDPYQDVPISHELGLKNWREQLPVLDPLDPESPPYRTFRMNMYLQIWLLEGREFRSPNGWDDGPEKTIWGQEQSEWLQKTLLESDATYKILISPTPLVGPDDAYKSDNHVNQKGFRQEGDAFFRWLATHEISRDHFFIVCGDRHWQYHAIHPSGYEEFSCGALVDANSRAGRMAGDPKSTDPHAQIRQPYIQGSSESASGGFLEVKISRTHNRPKLIFNFYDEEANLLYQASK